jgi:hypothetical protein
VFVDDGFCRLANLFLVPHNHHVQAHIRCRLICTIFENMGALHYIWQATPAAHPTILQRGERSFVRTLIIDRERRKFTA